MKKGKTSKLNIFDDAKCYYGTVDSKEFKSLYALFKDAKTIVNTLDTVSMGMSGDYKIAIEEGSTMVRIGSSIFGSR